MCVLNDEMIIEWAQAGGLTPFDPACVNPASVDLKFSGRVRCAYSSGWGDTQEVSELTLPPREGVVLSLMRAVVSKWKWIERFVKLPPEPVLFFLLDTTEVVTIPTHLCGYLYLKSSIGRQGLEHLHAGFFDPGFSGTATLEIVNTAPWPVTITRGQRLVQLVLERMVEPPLVSYTKTGRYNGQRGPQPAR